jgi:hypothetical protein
MPSTIVLRELAYEGQEARFLVLVVEPRFMPSHERGFHREIQEASLRASLETDSTDNFLIISIGLLFQEELAFEQGDGGSHGKESLTQMHIDGDLKDRFRIKVH